MKKLYMEYFHIPREGKVREKVMLVRMAVSTVFMILCLAAMSFSAYAYFSCSVASRNNQITAARFDMDVTLSITENATAVDVKKVGDKTYTAILEAGKTYEVVLRPAQESTATTGFCQITANNCEKTYHTHQLGIVDNSTVNEIRFTLEVSKNTAVQFLAHWGTSSYYNNSTTDPALYVQSGDHVKMEITAPGVQIVSVPDSTEPTGSTEPSGSTEPTGGTVPVQGTEPAGSTEPTQPPVTPQETAPQETTSQETIPQETTATP